MYSCPECGSDNVAGLSACHCGNDLSALQQLNAVADAWFNQGIEIGNQGRYGEAIEWLAACSVARPQDVECHRALAKVWCRLEHPDEAIRCVNRAIALAPEDSATLLLLAYVERKRSGIPANSSHTTDPIAESPSSEDRTEQIQPTDKEA